MSRIGKKPIPIPSGVEVAKKDNAITISGPLGNLTQGLPPGTSVDVEEGEIRVKIDGESRKARAFHGLARSLLANMVIGVSEGVSKVLDINGIGYRADVEGNVLVLNVGYSHPIRYELPENVSAEVDKNNQVTIKGVDKQVIGQVAAEIRSLRKPEPYKGKGIKYAGERLRRKAGKTGI
jgi:large subunit ribosomal protein L6